VVKLGGSLLGSDHLGAWLTALGDLAGEAVVVPGGGPFADAVRDAQRRTPFGDGAAHRMAILAMEQYAFLLAALEPRLCPADSPSRIAAARRAGQTPVWLPSRMTLGARDIPESWDVTSDSLAIWLADALKVRRVLLVKSAKIAATGVTAAALAADGIVDPLLPRFLADRDIDCRLSAAGEAQRFAAAVAARRSFGVEVRATA